MVRGQTDVSEADPVSYTHLDVYKRQDEMHIAIAPALLGTGEALFEGLDALALGYRCNEHAATGNATHIVLTRSA